jgi:hypothetical protein
MSNNGKCLIILLIQPSEQFIDHVTRFSIQVACRLIQVRLQGNYSMPLLLQPSYSALPKVHRVDDPSYLQALLPSKAFRQFPRFLPAFSRSHCQVREIPLSFCRFFQVFKLDNWDFFCHSLLHLKTILNRSIFIQIFFKIAKNFYNMTAKLKCQFNDL